MRRRRHILGDDRELVASQTRHEIAQAHRRPQSECNLGQQFVADQMPPSIVDRLEPIEVDHEDAEGLPLIQSGGRLFQRLAKEDAVGRAGQGIVAGQVDDLGLGCSTFRDVAQRAHEAAAR